jgi:hypothetical protein
MKQKGRDYSEFLIWAAGLVGMIRYSAAFLSSDLGKIVGVTSEIVTVLLGISGFAMGILATFGATYLFDGWRKKMPATGNKWSFKFNVLTIFVFLIFASELAILVPFTVSRMEQASMSEVLNGGVWWWSTAVNIMPLLLIAGVSVGNQVVSVSTAESSETYRQLTETPEESVGKLPKNWRKVRKGLSDEQVRNIAIDQAKNIAFHYEVDERTARNWRKYAQAEISKAESEK